MESTFLQKLVHSLILWVDTDKPVTDATNDKIDLLRLIPFLLLHLSCLLVFWVGVSYTAIITLLFTYWLRMFAITGFYHRYFSHKTFKTNRFWQFIFAFLGATAAQRGPLWWAAHHRHHHLKADKIDDVHSPVHNTFWWSHIGWFMAAKNFPTDYARVTDLKKYPELVFLNRFDMLAPLIFAFIIFAIGNYLGSKWPVLHTSGWQLLVWGFLISTVLVYHFTFAINSVAHRIGTRRFATKDESRNNFLLALFTLGEGWHNNHHQFPGSVRQGLKWWEIDLTYYQLLLLAKLKIISQLKYPFSTKIK